MPFIVPVHTKNVLVMLILTTTVSAKIGNFETHFYQKGSTPAPLGDAFKEVETTNSAGYVLLTQGMPIILDRNGEDRMLSDFEKRLKQKFGTEFAIPPLTVEVCEFGATRSAKLGCFCCGEWEDSSYGGLKTCQISTFFMCPEEVLRQRRQATSRSMY